MTPCEIIIFNKLWPRGSWHECIAKDYFASVPDGMSPMGCEDLIWLRSSDELTTRGVHKTKFRILLDFMLPTGFVDHNLLT